MGEKEPFPPRRDIASVDGMEGLIERKSSVQMSTIKTDLRSQIWKEYKVLLGKIK